MTAVERPDAYVPERVYLADEELSDTKHEYLGGVVHAMAGASGTHNILEINLYGMLYNRLRGRRCQAFGSNMKVLLRPLPTGRTYYYYPDAMIACDPSEPVEQGWRERPSVLFEILSESTRQIDEREKSMAYLQLASLEAYVRIEQTRPEAVVERRTLEGWKFERISGLEAIVRLPSLEIELPLAELYERVKFPSVGSLHSGS